MRVALLAFVAGSFLALLRNVIWLAMTYKLAPAYVDAAGPSKATLGTVGDTLISFGFVVGDQVGGALVGGVGVALFSAAILRTKLAAEWVGWLGFAVAVTAGWLTLLVRVSDVFGFLSFVGFVGFLVWLVAVGLRLWRWPARFGARAGDIAGSAH
jgi:hypothetical protein